ncbi:MAG: hypothetical protein H6838_12490 [Planctomycetes bacterium]|nr:hypothetical protein [Planctomycetota bacterium]
MGISRAVGVVLSVVFPVVSTLAQESVHDWPGYLTDGTSAGEFVVAGGLAWFKGYGNTGAELYVSDGTAAGTRLCIDLATGAEDGVERVCGTLGSSVLVEVPGGGYRFTDGSFAGTSAVFAIPPVGEVLGEVGGRLLYVSPLPGAAGWVTCSLDASFAVQTLLPGRATLLWANGGAWLEGGSLYSTDGTTNGTALVVPSLPHAVWSQGRFFGLRGGVFPAMELVVFDPATQTEVDIPLGPGFALGAKVVATPSGVVFSVGFSTELWTSDGTPAGTRRLNVPFDDYLYLVPWRDRALLCAHDAVHDYEPWICDGTEAGTRLLADLTPGASNAWEFAVTPTGTYFSVSQSGPAAAVVFTDGTPAGTRTVFQGDAKDLAAVGPHLLFRNSRSAGRGAVCGSDAAATSVAPVLPASNWGAVQGLTAPCVATGGQLLFFHDGAFRTSGTRSSTTLLEAEPFLILHPQTTAYPIAAATDDRVVMPFGSYMTSLDVAVWDSATHARAPLSLPATAQQDTFSAIAANGDRVFLAGLTLVITDGTTAGSSVFAMPSRATGPIAAAADRIFVGCGSSIATFDLTQQGWDQVGARGEQFLGTVGDRVVFVDDGARAAATDGLQVETLSTQPLAAGASLLAWQGTRWLLAGDLLSTDGTAAGTVAHVPPAGLELLDAAALEDGIYLVGRSAAHGKELWKFDGATFARITDLIAGPFDGVLSVATCGDKLFLAASDGSDGVEPYVSDGTAAGTFRIADLVPGPGSSSPEFLRVAGDHAYFLAQTPGASNVFAVPLGQLGVAHSERIGQGCVGRNGIPELTASRPPQLGDASFAFELTRGAQLAPVLFAIDGATTLQQYGPCRLRCAGGLGTVLRITNGVGAASWTVPIPSAAALLGLHVTAQAAVFDALASGPGFAASTALGCVIGD